MPRAKAQKGTDRERLFAAAYPANNFDGTKAAIAAGLSPRTAGQAASRMLKRVNVQDMIRENIDRAAQRLDLTLENVLAELWILGKSNMINYTHLDEETGLRLIDFRDATEVQMAAVSEVTVTEKIYKDEDGNTETVRTTKLKLHDKVTPLVTLGKHLGMASGPAGAKGGDEGTGDQHYHIHMTMPKPESEDEDRSYRDGPVIEHQPTEES